MENKLPDGPFNLTCQVDSEGMGLTEPERIVPSTDREWYLVLNGKLKLMAEVQNRTFIMMEKNDKANDATHQEIIAKIDTIGPKIDTLHNRFVPSKPFYFVLSVLVLVLGWFFIKIGTNDIWITRHATQYEIDHSRIEKKSDITIPNLPTQ